MMIFRQLFDPQSSTYSYLLGDARAKEAVLIDPVFEHVRRDAALIAELELKLIATLETHIHADHVTGAWLLKRQFDSAICLSAASGAEGADRYLAHGDRVQFGSRYLETRATPGHTHGCVTYVLDDESMAFTGDCLLIRGSGRTDFQQGDPRAMYRSVRSQILTLPPTCLLYPAHDYRGLTVTSVGEERRFNPRLGGEIGESDFVGYMNNLGLPHPKLIDIAVPANLRCGHPEKDTVLPADSGWAPLTFTFAGIWEIQPGALEENAANIQVVDVREPDEFALGHVSGASPAPLGTLASMEHELPAGRPLLTYCSSGQRSVTAASILERLGVGPVVDLRGGYGAWRDAGRD